MRAIAGFERPRLTTSCARPSAASRGSRREDWKKFLHDGFLADSAAETARAVSFNRRWSLRHQSVETGRDRPPSKDNSKSFSIAITRWTTAGINNNGWMQELPDPITKMTWENVILMSLKTAKDLGLFVNGKTTASRSRG